MGGRTGRGGGCGGGGVEVVLHTIMALCCRLRAGSGVLIG